MPERLTGSQDGTSLHALAFNNADQASIISDVGTGKILAANKSVCKLLGYSKKELLLKSRQDLFDTDEISFKKMMEQRAAEGHGVAEVAVTKKNGKTITCEVSSDVFRDADGVEKSITTITDITEKIRKQEIPPATNTVTTADEAENINGDPMESDEWIKHIATTSYDVMWDWNILTGEVYIGDSIEDVFGYKLENNTIQFRDIKKIQFLSPEKEDVAKKLMNLLESGDETWQDSYTIKKQDGSLAEVKSRASIIRDSSGKAIRMIGATQDVSTVKDLQKKLKEQDFLKKENKQIFQLAARLSYDGIWDWDIVKNEFFLGAGFEKLFGYPIKKEAGNITDWSKHIHPDDKDKVEKGMENALKSSSSRWDQAYRIINTGGSVLDVLGRASIVRDQNGKAYRMIGVVHDLTSHKQMESKLRLEIAARGKFFSAFQENFKMIFHSSPEVLYDLDLLNEQVILSDAYEKEFGYKIKNSTTSLTDWFSHIVSSEIESVKEDFQKVLASGVANWKTTVNYRKADQTVCKVVITGIVLISTSGKAYRMMGSMQDVSKQHNLELKLEQKIKIKEKEIAEAMEEAKESERSEIGKELHDNVNQLLGVSKLYLEMAKRGGAESKMYLDRSSEYTLSAIEAIRELTKGLTTDDIKNLGLRDAIENMANDTMEVNEIKISCNVAAFNESAFDNKFKINTFRIVQEQLNNIIKHAHATRVDIGLVDTNAGIVLTLSDNGSGFDTTKRSKGIGMDNIRSRAERYNGKAEFVSQPGQGCILTVKFPHLPKSP